MRMAFHEDEALEAHGIAPDLEASTPKLGPLVAIAAARVRSSRRHAGGRAAVTVGAFTGRGAPHRVAAGGAADPLRIRPARAVPMMGHATSNRSPADSHMPRATAMVM